MSLMSPTSFKIELGYSKASSNAAVPQSTVRLVRTTSPRRAPPRSPFGFGPKQLGQSALSIFTPL
jgi:hypothetical protein